MTRLQTCWRPYRASAARSLAHNLGMLNVILARSGREPAWAGNLRANPMASVRVRRDEIQVIAHEAEGEERERPSTLVRADQILRQRGSG